MLFNLDRNLKQSLFAEYKKEALLHSQKRLLEKQQKLKEEQEYLKRINQQEEKSMQKLKEEEKQRKNEQMNYYKEIFNSPNKNSRKKELIIKIWENPKKTESTRPKNNIFRKEDNKNKYEVDYNSLSPEQKKKLYIIKGDDHMKRLLTDNQNEDEISKYMKEEQSYRQKYYKDLINSQYEEAQRINKDRYGTNDILIIEKKRRQFLNENNYGSKKQYDYLKTNLKRNPITNPENNIAYNKYINYRLNRSNIFKNSLPNKNGLSLMLNNAELSPVRRVVNTQEDIMPDNVNNNLDIFKHKTICQSESNLLKSSDNYNQIDNYQSNNEANLNINNYGRFSKDNIFNYNKKLKEINTNTPMRNKYDVNNAYENKTNGQTIETGSILSQAAKSNFLI